MSIVKPVAAANRSAAELVHDASVTPVSTPGASTPCNEASLYGRDQRTASARVCGSGLATPALHVAFSVPSPVAGVQLGLGSRGDVTLNSNREIWLPTGSGSPSSTWRDFVRLEDGSYAFHAIAERRSGRQESREDVLFTTPNGRFIARGETMYYETAAGSTPVATHDTRWWTQPSWPLLPGVHIDINYGRGRYDHFRPTATLHFD